MRLMGRSLLLLVLVVLVIRKDLLVVVPRLLRCLLRLLARRVCLDVFALLLGLLRFVVLLHEALLASLHLAQLGLELLLLQALLGVLIIMEHILVMVPRLVRRLLCLLAGRLGFDL